MDFCSFIICVILCVIVVQPTNGAANATLQSAIDQADGNRSKNKAFSEGGEFNIDGSKEVKVSDDVLKLLAQGAQGEKHSRGVTKTGIAPAADDIHETKNNSTTNGTKNVAQSNNNQTVTGLNTNQAAPKVESKPVTTVLNDQTKGADSKPQLPLATSTSTTTTTTTTTVATPTTTKSTTPKPTTKIPLPKKPLITISVEDVPGLVTKVAEAQSQLPVKESPVEEVRDDEPLSLQSSGTITYPDQRSTHNYIMLIVGILVIVPLMVLVTNCAIKRARDYWSKRRYRRMDYLIEDMYN